MNRLLIILGLFWFGLVGCSKSLNNQSFEVILSFPEHLAPGSLLFDEVAPHISRFEMKVVQFQQSLWSQDFKLSELQQVRIPFSQWSKQKEQPLSVIVEVWVKDCWGKDRAAFWGEKEILPGIWEKFWEEESVEIPLASLISEKDLLCD